MLPQSSKPLGLTIFLIINKNINTFFPSPSHFTLTDTYVRMHTQNVFEKKQRQCYNLKVWWLEKNQMLCLLYLIRSRPIGLITYQREKLKVPPCSLLQTTNANLLLKDKQICLVLLGSVVGSADLVNAALWWW